MSQLSISSLKIQEFHEKSAPNAFIHKIDHSSENTSLSTFAMNIQSVSEDFCEQNSKNFVEFLEYALHLKQGIGKKLDFFTICIELLRSKLVNKSVSNMRLKTFIEWASYRNV